MLKTITLNQINLNCNTENTLNIEPYFRGHN